METIYKEQPCCFFGHRKIKHTKDLETAILENAEKLITERNVSTFLFGSKSEFDDLCHALITKLQERHPHIRRIYVRAEYPYIDENYTNHLLQFYEDAYYPERMINAGRAAYVERNYEMIDNSSFCIVYYEENYKPPMRKNSKRDLLPYQPKSGTGIAFAYAQKRGNEIINVFNQPM